MKKLGTFGAISLVVGLVLALFVLPPMFKRLNEAKAVLDRQEKQITALEAQAAFAKTQAAVDAGLAALKQPVSNDVAEPGIAEPVLAKNPEPTKQTVDLGGAPSCVDLSATRPWYDDPKKNGAGKTHQNLRYALVRPSSGAQSCYKQPFVWVHDGTGDLFVYEKSGLPFPGPLPPTTYSLSYGTLIVHRPQR